MDLLISLLRGPIKSNIHIITLDTNFLKKYLPEYKYCKVAFNYFLIYNNIIVIYPCFYFSSL